MATSTSSSSSSSSSSESSTNLLQDLRVWLLFICRHQGCGARLYIGLTKSPAGDDILVIRRTTEPHKHRALGCLEHSSTAPCIDCQTRRSVTNHPCVQATSECLTAGTLASHHQLSMARMFLANKSANSSSPTMLFQV